MWRGRGGTLVGVARADVRSLPLADNSVDLIFTDPPYARESLPLYEMVAQEAARLLRTGGFALVMCGGLHNGPIHKMFLDAGLTCFLDIAYAMDNGRASGYVPHIGVLMRSKFILCYSKGKGKLRVQGMHNLYVGRKDKMFHHWGQDVDYARYYIDHFSAEGDLVVDPMVGGGTTGVACQLINRRFIGFDLDPAACRITHDRLQNSDAIVNLPLFANG